MPNRTGLASPQASGVAEYRTPTRPLTRPNPVDRGKPGSKIHALSDHAGLPLTVGVSAANTNDHHAVKPLVRAIPAVRSRRAPDEADPPSSTPIKPMTSPSYAHGCASEESRHASPALALGRDDDA
jgi:hypothetical protein